MAAAQTSAKSAQNYDGRKVLARELNVEEYAGDDNDVVWELTFTSNGPDASTKVSTKVRVWADMTILVPKTKSAFIFWSPPKKGAKGEAQKYALFTWLGNDLDVDMINIAAWCAAKIAVIMRDRRRGAIDILEAQKKQAVKEFDSITKTHDDKNRDKKDLKIEAFLKEEVERAEKRKADQEEKWTKQKQIVSSLPPALTDVLFETSMRNGSDGFGFAWQGFRTTSRLQHTFRGKKIPSSFSESVDSTPAVNLLSTALGKFEFMYHIFTTSTVDVGNVEHNGATEHAIQYAILSLPDDLMGIRMRLHGVYLGRTEETDGKDAEWFRYITASASPGEIGFEIPGWPRQHKWTTIVQGYGSTTEDLSSSVRLEAKFWKSVDETVDKKKQRHLMQWHYGNNTFGVAVMDVVSLNVVRFILVQGAPSLSGLWLTAPISKIGFCGDGTAVDQIMVVSTAGNGVAIPASASPGRHWLAATPVPVPNVKIFDTSDVTKHDLVVETKIENGADIEPASFLVQKRSYGWVKQSTLNDPVESSRKITLHQAGVAKVAPDDNAPAAFYFQAGDHVKATVVEKFTLANDSASFTDIMQIQDVQTEDHKRVMDFVKSKSISIEDAVRYLKRSSICGEWFCIEQIKDPGADALAVEMLPAGCWGGKKTAQELAFGEKLHYSYSQWVTPEDASFVCCQQSTVKCTKETPCCADCTCTLNAHAKKHEHSRSNDGVADVGSGGTRVIATASCAHDGTVHLCHPSPASDLKDAVITGYSYQALPQIQQPLNFKLWDATGEESSELSKVHGKSTVGDDAAPGTETLFGGALYGNEDGHFVVNPVFDDQNYMGIDDGTTSVHGYLDPFAAESDSVQQGAPGKKASFDLKRTGTQKAIQSLGRLPAQNEQTEDDEGASTTQAVDVTGGAEQPQYEEAPTRGTIVRLGHNHAKLKDQKAQKIDKLFSEDRYVFTVPVKCGNNTENCMFMYLWNGDDYKPRSDVDATIESQFFEEAQAKGAVAQILAWSETEKNKSGNVVAVTKSHVTAEFFDIFSEESKPGHPTSRMGLIVKGSATAAADRDYLFFSEGLGDQYIYNQPDAEQAKALAARVENSPTCLRKEDRDPGERNEYTVTVSFDISSNSKPLRLENNRSGRTGDVQAIPTNRTIAVKEINGQGNKNEAKKIKEGFILTSIKRPLESEDPGSPRSEDAWSTVKRNLNDKLKEIQEQKPVDEKQKEIFQKLVNDLKEGMLGLTAMEGTKGAHAKRIELIQTWKRKLKTVKIDFGQTATWNLKDVEGNDESLETVQKEFDRINKVMGNVKKGLEDEESKVSLNKVMLTMTFEIMIDASEADLDDHFDEYVHPDPPSAKCIGEKCGSDSCKKRAVPGTSEKRCFKHTKRLWFPTTFTNAFKEACDLGTTEWFPPKKSKESYIVKTDIVVQGPDNPKWTNGLTLLSKDSEWQSALSTHLRQLSGMLIIVETNDCVYMRLPEIGKTPTKLARKQSVTRALGALGMVRQQMKSKKHFSFKTIYESKEPEAFLAFFKEEQEGQPAAQDGGGKPKKQKSGSVSSLHSHFPDPSGNAPGDTDIPNKPGPAVKETHQKGWFDFLKCNDSMNEGVERSLIKYYMHHEEGDSKVLNRILPPDKVRVPGPPEVVARLPTHLPSCDKQSFKECDCKDLFYVQDENGNEQKVRKGDRLVRIFEHELDESGAPETKQSPLFTLYFERPPLQYVRRPVHPLFVAAKHGHDKLVEYFIENWELNEKSLKDVKLNDENGQTPLMTAVVHGHFKVAALLLSKLQYFKNGSSVTVADNAGLTPLDKAHSIMLVIDSELNAGQEDLEKKNSKFGWVASESTFLPPLHFAVKEGKKDLVKFLLDAGASRKMKKSTSLFESAGQTDVKSVEKYAAKYKKSIHGTDEHDIYNLINPKKSNTGSGIDEFIGELADWEATLMKTLVGDGGKTLEGTQIFDSNPGLFFSCDPNGNTLLHHAVMDQNLDMVQELLGVGEQKDFLIPRMWLTMNQKGEDAFCIGARKLAAACNLAFPSNHVTKKSAACTCKTCTTIKAAREVLEAVVNGVNRYMVAGRLALPPTDNPRFTESMLSFVEHYPELAYPFVEVLWAVQITVPGLSSLPNTREIESRDSRLKRSFLHKYVNMSDEHQDIVFSMSHAQQLVDFKWEKFGQSEFNWEGVLYLILLVTFAVQSFFIVSCPPIDSNTTTNATPAFVNFTAAAAAADQLTSQERISQKCAALQGGVFSDDALRIAPLICVFIVLILSSRLLKRECQQILFNGPRLYWADPWNCT